MMIGAYPTQGALFTLSRQFSSNGADNKESDFDAHSDFEPKEKISSEDDAVVKMIDDLVENNDICVFMKGTRKMPRCGFSNYVVQILKFYGVKDYKDVNVLEDEKLRNGIKEYSNWPTIPQVYIKGDFIGGCDIMKEIHADGTLEKLLVGEGLIKGELQKK
mmetsp:Transcript_13924/g.23686  ORF Transcript_13924/g.23686 Transcript_13924/m.23686 type:complete len:161 (-) Transcript_13924:45-527(-)